MAKELFNQQEKLNKLLTQKYMVESEIKKIFDSVELDSVRFSSKKFVGDLGEFYFGIHASTDFEEIKQSKESNADFDYSVVLKSKSSLKLDFGNGIIRVEVKTRYDQEGNNHIFGLIPKKFDLLAFVMLDEQYKCKHIGLIPSSNIQTDNQNRIRYNDYCRNNKVIALYGELPIVMRKSK